MKKINYIGIGAALCVPALAVAALELPFEFSEGDRISASKMNDNFQALADKIDNLEAADDALSGKVEELEAANAELVKRVDQNSSSDWLDVTYDNEYAEFDSELPVRCRVRNGVVEMEGVVNGEAANNGISMFTLPSECRPHAERRWIAPHNTDSVTGVAQLSVLSSGEVVQWAPHNSKIISLDGLRYAL